MLRQGIHLTCDNITKKQLNNYIYDMEELQDRITINLGISMENIKIKRND